MNALYKLITGDKPLSLFIVFLIGLGIWLPDIILAGKTVPPGDHQNLPFYQFTLNLFNNRAFIIWIIAFILVLIQGMLIYRINIRYSLIQKRTFLPALFYIILTGFLPELHQLNEVLIASVFVLLICGKLMGSYYVEPNSYRLLDAGIILGIGMLFYAPLVYYITFIWIALAILRKFYWREYLYPILGLLIPASIYLTWLFLNDSDIKGSLVFFRNELFGGFPSIYLPTPQLIFLCYSALLVFLASIYMLKVFQFRKIYIRSYFMIFFWLFVISIVIFGLLSGFNKGLLFIISIPVAFIMTNYFITGKDLLVNRILLFIFVFGVPVILILEALGVL